MQLFFLSNYGYRVDDSINSGKIMIEDDKGNVINSFSGLSYKNAVHINSNINNKYIRIRINGDLQGVKICIRNGKLN